MEEHLWTRRRAGLFDVSHMGPCFLSLADSSLSGEAAHQAISAQIEKLVPSSISSLSPGQARLTVLLNENGGILDDLIVTRPFDDELQGTLYLVVNGAMKHEDWALFERTLSPHVSLQLVDDRALMALQGPEAAEALGGVLPGCGTLNFMQGRRLIWRGQEVWCSRCGYTGEDGFEVLVPAEVASDFARVLLADERVRPVGLGARDSLRLEAGLCLYGQDLDPRRTPVEADLAWVIQKSRRVAADFPGADRILEELVSGPRLKRVGIEVTDKAPARHGTEIQLNDESIGMVTSGGFSPCLKRPIAMGYVRSEFAIPGTEIDLIVRGRPRAGRICTLPFVQPNYQR
jgi:aminomethyltransferase